MTYINVCDPAQSADHARLWNSVSSVQSQGEKRHPGYGLRRSGVPERCRESAEPCLHREIHRENEEEEDTVNASVFRNLDSPVSEGGENFSTGYVHQ